MKRFLSFLLSLIFLLPGTYAAAESPQVKGVWVSSVANLDFPSRKGLSAESLRAEIDSIITCCKQNNINTVFFQVRPNSDALYASEIFPWSEVISGTQAVAPDGGFDPLEYIIEKAHKEGISLHAWINPYRIGDLSKASANNPAKLHPEYVVSCSDGKAYYNPALPEVRQLVMDGVLEIIENYDVDGIHFDDYFYPYDVDDFPDGEAFEKYGKEFDDIADFRRNNVNILVKQVGELVHKKDKSLKFGISPFGIWDNKRDNPLGSETTGMSSYSEIYADSRYWVTENLVDYICPQIYWSFENTAAPFAKVLDWWDNLCKDSKTELYVGIALYKQGTDENGWQDKDQILRQLTLCESKPSVKGTVFFRYGSLAEPVEYETDIIQPTLPVTSSSIKITGPANNYKTEGANCSVTGMSDPSKPLSVNGSPVTMTAHGYFSVYLPLKHGSNTFTFSNGESSASVTVRRVTADTTEAESFIESAYPSGECMFYAGEMLTLSAKAPENSSVFAIIDGKELAMTENADSGSYELCYQLPNIVTNSEDKISVEFAARKDGKEYSFSEKADITVLSSPLRLFTASECYVYDSPYGGSMMDNYQYPKASEIWASALVGDMYRLSTGKWIYKSDVSETEPESVVDIDTSKYVETTFLFENSCTYQCNVTEYGQLEIDFYHSHGDSPKINEAAGAYVRYIKSATRTKAVVTLRGSKITGYYISKNGDNDYSLWLYKNSESGLTDKIIVLDPGHGGEDPGALGPPGADGATESDLNLSMAILLKEKLEKAGATVYLTRTDDSTLLLKDRAELIRSYNPDICLSLHHNSVSRESDFNAASGTVVLYSRETSKPLAESLCFNITGGTGIKNNGSKTQSLNVCRDYRYPCVLVECGFVCNPAEYEKLLTDNFKNALCNNIVLSIADYFG